MYGPSLEEGGPDVEQPRQALIFRGVGKITRWEKQSLSPKLDYYYQKCAWVDRQVAQDWDDRTMREYSTRKGGGPWADLASG